MTAGFVKYTLSGHELSHPVIHQNPGLWRFHVQRELDMFPLTNSGHPSRFFGRGGEDVRN